MKFSIVTSFYNESPKYIDEVCNSVLNQTHTNFEWVVTDDFSHNEETTKLVKSLPLRDKRIRYVEQKSKKEVWWNPHTYAIGDIVITVDGDDHIFPKTLEVYNYFYSKYLDVICMTTDIRNYVNGEYKGSIYINYENYKSHMDYIFNNPYDNDIIKHGTSDYFGGHGYNRSWRNINGLDFKGDLDNRLIIVDLLQLFKLEEMGKLLHLPRALYGYNTREKSISRTINEYNDLTIRTQEIDQLLKDRRTKEVNSIKRIFNDIFIESTAFLDCDINYDTTSKNVLFITPYKLSLFKQEQLNELYFDHNIYYNDYRDDVDYCLVLFDSPEQYYEFFKIYENIKKYIGKIQVIIQISYKKIDQPENNLMVSIVEYLKLTNLRWFDFDNHYITIKLF